MNEEFRVWPAETPFPTGESKVIDRPQLKDRSHRLNASETTFLLPVIENLI